MIGKPQMEIVHNEIHDRETPNGARAPWSSLFFKNLKDYFENLKNLEKNLDVHNVVFYQRIKSHLEIPYIQGYAEKTNLIDLRGLKICTISLL
jgi:hypothetical protein